MNKLKTLPLFLIATGMLLTACNFSTNTSKEDSIDHSSENSTENSTEASIESQESPSQNSPISNTNPWGGSWSFDWGSWGGGGNSQGGTSQGGDSQGPALSSVDAPESNAFSIKTDLTAIKEIHTAAQKTYLAYNGDYSQIPENQYPDGKSHSSDPEGVALEWDYTVPTGKTLQLYSVVFGQKSDLSDGYEQAGDTNKSITLYNVFLGTNYFKIVARYTDGTADASPIKSFNVDNTAPRNLKIGGMTNCRDIGGRATEDGGRIKQGLVYRTSGFKYDYSTQITAAGKTVMLDHMKVKTEINVSDNQNYNLNLTGTTVKNLFMDYSGGLHHFSRNAENVKNFFKVLADESNYPVYFHCRIGTDRTGLCANLLYGLLGVPLNEIYQDYLFSNFGNIQEKRYIGDKAGKDNILKYINFIKSMSGKTFKNKTYNALLAIGVSRETLDKVISNLTEGQVAKDNDAGQILATADKLTGNGVNVSVDSSERNHPDNYFVLNSTSKSVSYNFTTTKDFKGQIVAYLGNSNSNSNLISDAVSCKIDSSDLSIENTTFELAGMGNCSNRMNYFPVILGTMDIPAGSHTITLTGKNYSMNVGGLYIFDANNAGGGGSQGGDDPVAHTTHSYKNQGAVKNINNKDVTTYLCDCGKKYIDIKFTDYSSITGSIGTDGKITNGSVIKWDVPAKAGTVKLMFNIKCSSSNHLTNASAVFNPANYTIKVNGETKPITLATSTTQYGDLGFTTSGQYFAFSEFEIANDSNLEIELDHNCSDYRLIFTENLRLMYETW